MSPHLHRGWDWDKDRVILGSGFHEKAGEPHAEINALKAVGPQAEGATVYVTLEPCNHFGRTPPCVDALIQARVARVVIAAVDPNPKVNGTGIEKLRAHGIEVTTGVLAEKAVALNKGFHKRMQQDLPWVRLKMAMTLDGKIADVNGDSKWITHEAARQDVQLWRAQSQVIITGVSTVIKDNPHFTVRDKKITLLRKKRGVPLQPLLVVCDTHLRTPKNANIFADNRAVWLATVGAGSGFAAEIKQFPIHHGRIDLKALLKHLAERGHNEVLVEAGSTLAGAFLEANLVDELIVYYAPKLMGDAGQSAFCFREPKSMAQLQHFSMHSVKTFGDDVRLIYLNKEA